MTDGRSYNERMPETLIDGVGYVTELLNSQERQPSDKHIKITNALFNKLASKPIITASDKIKDKNKRYNKILNETVKNSSPQFYVEQSFKANGSNKNNGRYTFKLDPNFMSCNSVYKTVALRGIFMKPKRYTCRYKFEGKVEVPQADPVALPVTNKPTFEYMTIIPNKPDSINRLWKVNAKIIDSDGNEYIVKCELTPSSGKVKHMRVTINNTYVGEINGGRTIEDIDVGDGKTVNFTFYPRGTVIIQTFYTAESINYRIEERFVKVNALDKNDTNCKEITKFKYTFASTLATSVNLSITLLPENSIEVFAYEICKQVNEKLNSDSSEHIKACELDFDYEDNTNTLEFKFRSTITNDTVECRFIPIDNLHESDSLTFYNILNQSNFEINPDFDSNIVFNNVWNREYFFVHASYMNLVQYNQLGRTDEIYPKPTKLTRYTSSIPDIEFWTSMNGVDPFNLVDQDFEVDAALAATLNNADITF